MNSPQRKSPRLQGYDYSLSGAYFVTICTYRREAHFGWIVADKMQPSVVGAITTTSWDRIPTLFPKVSIDAFVVMPNHVHGIFVIDQPETDEKRITLGQVVRAYKALVTRSVNQTLGLRAPRLWQSRYHDHIIRNDMDLNRLRAYIDQNPARWQADKFYAVPPSPRS